MVANWKVSWNSQFYNYKKLISDYKDNKHSGIIYQSKGRAIMKNMPKINDYAYISCDKKKILKCKILTEFVNGNEEKCDLYNLGSNRNHSNNNIYLTMKIEHVYDEPTELKGCQRTWCKYKNN